MKKNEGFAEKNFLDKKERIETKHKIQDLLRTNDLKKMFSKKDTTKWSDKLYKKTEIVNDTIPICRMDNLKKRFDETLLKKTDLTLKEKKDVLKSLNLKEMKMTLTITAYANQFIR